ncbi:MAG: glycosyltransferase family 4 protein [Mycoplasmataceae bacterium]|nr:glycosyltransferase family 4 protein [Mycoplasmataceae bacterium]
MNKKSILDKIGALVLPTRDERISKMDVYLSFSFLSFLPNKAHIYLVWHDLLPLKMYDLYIKTDNSLAGKIFNLNPLMTKIGKHIKKIQLNSIINKAEVLIADSDYTRDDVIKTFKNVNPRVEVAKLGVSTITAKTNGSHAGELPLGKYLLYVGGADSKREIHLLIKAFGELRNNNIDIKLVLAGGDFYSVHEMNNSLVKEAILNSGFYDDIILFGYITDEFKQKLYKNSFAFIYPTLFEGFGLPVLEAMLYKTLILTYNNTSLPEVGQDYAFYVDNGNQMAEQITIMLAMSDEERSQRIEAAYKYASRFTWDKTAQRYYEIIMSDKAYEKLESWKWYENCNQFCDV